MSKEPSRKVKTIGEATTKEFERWLGAGGPSSTRVPYWGGGRNEWNPRVFRMNGDDAARLATRRLEAANNRIARRRRLKEGL